MSRLDEIILALDMYMDKEGKSNISPTEGNKYLASIGLLQNYDRSGSQLRELCRNGFIRTARQPGGKGTKWVIYHSSKKGFALSKKLEETISSSNGEREVAAFLGKHPELLRWAVCRTGGHCNYVLKEFPFGSHYKADFVVLTSYSGAWEVHFIELEPHDDMVITKAGTPSKRLSGAISQIKDWEDYVVQNQVQIRRDLSDWCIKKDLLGESKSVKKPVNGSGHYLSDIGTFIHFYYHIVIGSRNVIDEEKRRRINQLTQHTLKIFTYGRLIDIAKNFDRYANGESYVRLTESEEE